jgi:hypothetical protein
VINQIVNRKEAKVGWWETNKRRKTAIKRNTDRRNIERRKERNNRPKTKQMGRNEKAESKGQTLKIAYANIEGKGTKEWNTIREMVEQERWDVLALAETHWRGKRNRKIEGYEEFIRNRDIQGKKGGGLAIWVKEDLVAYEWENQDDDIGNETKNERMWVNIEGEEEDLTIGLVYMGAESNKNNEWNKAVEERLTDGLCTL